MSMSTLMPGWFGHHADRMLNYNRLASAGILFPADRQGLLIGGSLHFKLRADVELPLLRRALAKNPVDRFSSAAEFAHALQLVQYDGGMPVTPLELADAVPLPDREPDAVPAFVRPRVPHESPRRKRTRDREATGRAPSDDLPETMTRRRPALLWSAIIGGAIVVTGVAAAVIVSVI